MSWAACSPLASRTRDWLSVIFCVDFGISDSPRRGAERLSLGLVTVTKPAPPSHSPANGRMKSEAVSVDDGGATLALAHVAAKRQGLAKGEPTLTGKPCSMTAPQRIRTLTSAVLPCGSRVFRHRNRNLRCRRSPRLNPWDAAGLKLGDDLIGDFLIEARPILAGASASGVSGHCGSPRWVPRVSRGLQPSRLNPAELSLCRASDSLSASYTSFAGEAARANRLLQGRCAGHFFG
jgi:hypothetical protein